MSDNNVSKTPKINTWWIVAGIVLLLALWLVGSYNSLVSSRETVRAAVANVEAQYQRRSDLIPNLVKTVEGSKDFEKDTLTQVVEARAKATQTQINPDDLSAESLQQYQNAQGELSQALGRLLVSVEAYPDIKSTQNFKDLQTQLEGTENRIAVARQDYNETARSYNTKIQRFPASVTAGLFGFDDFAYFQSQSGADKAPEVNFN